MNPSQKVLQKLVESGIVTGEFPVTIAATRFSVYRRETQWLPRSRVTENRGEVCREYLSDYTVTQLSRMPRLFVMEYYGDLFIHG